MANEDNLNADGSDGTGGSPDDSKVTVDRTEFERMQKAEAFYRKLEETAAEFDVETPEEYLDVIEANANRNVTESLANKPAAKKPDEAARPSGGQPDPGAEQSRVMAAQAVLTSNWTEFKSDQKDLPQDERSTYSKDDLMKAIRGPEGPVVAKLAHAKFDGNLFAAANYLKTNTDPDRIAKARKAGADSEAAKNRARESADLGTGGRTQEPNDSTSAERERADAEKRRTSIAPKDNYVFPG